MYTSQKYNVPTSGTMAHSWVQSFNSEYEAFKAYAETYPNDCMLLVDTYNVLKSGIPNAIKVFNEVLLPLGCRPKGIRIDSGDLAYLSKKARKMLDEAGFEDCKICGTNALDEFLITSLLDQNAEIDSFGVGENLITAQSNPVFGGVYKLAAIEENGVITPKIKVSENIEKITNPGFKKLYRFYNNKTGKAIADLITLNDEEISTDEYTIFDPISPWKKKTLTEYTLKPLHTKIFENGKLIYTSPTLTEIANNAKNELDTLWDEVKRLNNPHKYYVDLSQELWDLKQKLLEEIN